MAIIPPCHGEDAGSIPVTCSKSKPEELIISSFFYKRQKQMNKIKCLSNNTLKIIACISMFFDHFGFLIFPNKIIYRVIGRLAFPIFAYMIAEGSLHTKNKTKHLLIIGWLGIIMQIVLYYFTGMQDFSIFIHFTFSIILIRLFDYFIDNIKQKKYILSVLGILTFILLAST